MSEGMKERDLRNLGLALTLAVIAACSEVGPTNPAESPQGEPVPQTQTVDSPSPTELPPLPSIAPESFTAQADILRDQGYELKNEGGIFRFVESDSGKEVITAKNESTVVVKTQSGEELEFPQEAFGVEEVAGVGVSAILTLESPDGKVEYFYLNHEDNEYWTTPIEMQTNPEVIENYTPIEIEDVWSGRLLYSELLGVGPFPEGTLVPDSFFYVADLWPTGKVFRLTDFIEGTSDYFKSIYGDDDVYIYNVPEIYYNTVKENNDPRRWAAFYRSKTPSGGEVIIATEQVLAPDGKASYLWHYTFGHEWPWDRNYRDPETGDSINLIDSIFLAKNRNFLDGGIDRKYTVSPVIFFQASQPEWQDYFFTVVTGVNPPKTAGVELYNGLDQNNPLLLNQQLNQAVQERNSILNSNNMGFLQFAGVEVEGLQYMALLGQTEGFLEQYFNLD